MDNVDMLQDSGRYLQEYIQSLENLPSEINYHWAEIQNREEQGKNLEKRVHAQQLDLSKLHRQWFHQESEKREKILKHEPNIIKRIRRDYDKLEDLATERIQLAETALHLVDRHLERISHDLDILNKTNPELLALSNVQHLLQRNGTNEIETEEDEEDEEEHDEEAYIAAMMANRQKKRKKKETRDSEENTEEPLYCYCRQVSYGEMVGCDGEHCPYEWFHMECTGLDAPPKGEWFCKHCLESENSRKIKKMKRKKESSTTS